MSAWIRLFASIAIIFSFFSTGSALADTTLNIPILCYHNLNPTKPGSMNLTPDKFESQIKWLKDNGFTIIPLSQAVAYLQGKQNALPKKPIVITVDDGWKSVYTYMQPIVKKHNFPVTLFIFPQTISQGKNSMTWEELKELQQTGLFDIQSHTYDHPNFKQMKRRKSDESYAAYVKNQMMKSKQILEDKMGTKVSYLAWPFGIYDKFLENAAADAGYVMAFTIDYRAANRNDRPMAEPRYMIIDQESQKTFESIVNRAGKLSTDKQ